MRYHVDTTLVAASTGTASVALDHLLSFADKILTGCVVAIVTALVHTAAKWFWKKVFK